MNSNAENQLKIPTIDFRGLHPDNPKGQLWDSVRALVLPALQTFGCFEAIYDGVKPELKETLFRKAVPELFALPVETKSQNVNLNAQYQGYIGGIPNMAYESMRIHDSHSIEGVEEFATMMWPGEGNPTFCNTVWRFSQHVEELEQMVGRMILQSLGVENYYDSYLKSANYRVRLSEYGVPLDQETKIALPAHRDPTRVTIVCQDQEGLEVQTKEGEWIHISPQPNSFNVMIGTIFQVLSNGRLYAPMHRVRMTANQKRYSSIMASGPVNDSTVQVLEGLVDDKHPLLYKPFVYNEYVKFVNSDEGRKLNDPLTAFCGVDAEK